MGAQLIYGTAGATGGGWSAQPGSLQPALSERSHEPRWQWQARAPKTWKDKNWWYSLWSYGCRMTGGSEVTGGDGGATVGSNNLSGKDLFEPYSCDGDGNQSLKFLKGLAVDTSDAPLSGVNLQAFRTSDDTFAGYEVQSREDGSYDLATNFPGVNHYIVAYLAGSPDRAGTTVNTLVPANIDGT